MTKNQFHKVNFTQEQRIINKLMLETDFMPKIGLLDGKMGIVLTFAHLYKQYGNPVYDEIAESTLDSLIKKICVTTSIDFATGLTGIVWGIEYLINNKFMKGNAVKICKHIDSIIIEKDPRRMDDISLESGLEGILHYTLAHLSFRKDKQNIQPFDEIYQNDLLTAIKLKKNVSDNFRHLTKQFEDYLSDKTLFYKFDVKQFIRPIEYNKIINVPSDCLCIRNGIAANLLEIILK